MKVSTVLTIIFFVVALLGSIGGTSYYYLQSMKSVEEQVYFGLETISQSRAAHIISLLNEQKEKIEIAATHQQLSNGELKEIKNITNEFYELFVLSPNGKIIASSDESKIGIDRSLEDYFINGKKETYIQDAYLSEITGKNSIAISTPQEANVLVARIETTKLNEITLDKTGLGETGEVYLINKNSYAISPLLLVEDAFLKWKVDSIGSRVCLEDLENYSGIGTVETHGEVIQHYLDYHGEKVIGTHSYVPSMNWCLLSEINEEEVLGKQKILFQKVSLIITGSITLIATLIGLLIGRFIDKVIVLKKRRKSL